jgi:hypothetical protein
MNTFVPVLVKLESLLSITVVFLLFFRRHLLQQGSRVRKLVRVDSLEEMGPGNGVGTTNGNGANAEYQPALQVIILVCKKFFYIRLRKGCFAVQYHCPSSSHVLGSA